MNFIPTFIRGVYVVELNPFLDQRGSFVRNFCKNEFKEIGLNKEIVQINHSLTKNKGAFRGLHFQKPPYSEIKIIRCIKGSVYDVVVDIRKDSPTFLQHFAVNLNENEYKMIVIPEGCAHGFQSLEENCELIYLHTAFYEPDHEGGLNIDDPKLNIELPLPITEISERDKNHPLITENFKGI